MVHTKTSPTKTNFQSIYRFYLDAKCAGDVIYTITNAGEKSMSKDNKEEYGDTEGFLRLGENSIVYEGSKTIDGSAADLLEYKEARLSNKTAPFRVGSGKTLSPEYTVGLEFKAIAKIDGDKLTMRGGNEKNYPTTFIHEGSWTFTKQKPQ